MVIIKAEPLKSGQHQIVSNDQEKAPWLPGYIEVPSHLEQAAWASLGYCDLIIEDGKLVGITPLPIPEPEPVAEPPTPQEDADALLVDHEYRITLLELGVTSDAV